MTPLTIAIICFIVFVVLLFIGVQVAFSFAIAGFGGLVAIAGLEPSLVVIGNAIVANTSKEMLIAIPLFVFMGFLVLVSEIGNELYKVANIWLGRMPGGLAQATTAACAGFAACTGDSLGATATMASISYPILRKYNYDDKLSTACTAVGGTLGILIPPSVPMITYGFLASVSTGALFVAGILPGIVVCMCLMLVTGIMCKHNPLLGPKSSYKYTLKEKFKAINAGVWYVLFLFLLIIGGLYFGIFAPSEAGAVGAMGAFGIVIMRKKLTLASLKTALLGACKIACFLFTMIACAIMFQMMLVMAGFMSKLHGYMNGLDISPYAILIIVIVIWTIMGMFMEQLAIQLLTVPIFAPVIAAQGFDLVWFGIISIIVAEMGILTPPVGINCFVVSNITGVPAKDVFRGVMPYLGALTIALVIMIVFPQIALVLPQTMR